MSTHNIQFHDKIKKKKKKKTSINIIFIELSEEFRRDSKTTKRVKNTVILTPCYSRP